MNEEILIVKSRDEFRQFSDQELKDNVLDSVLQYEGEDYKVTGITFNTKLKKIILHVHKIV